MGLSKIVSGTLLALQLSESSFAVPLVESRGDVCTSGIYGELSPILRQYAVAQAFCSAVYPVSCTSRAARLGKRVTTTKSTTSTVMVATSTTSSKTTTKSTTKTTTSSDPKASAWSKCQGQPGNVVKTICSCIETPKPCTSKTSATSSTTTRGTVSSSSTTSSSTTISSSTTTSLSTTTSSASTTTTSENPGPTACVDGPRKALTGGSYDIQCQTSWSTYVWEDYKDITDLETCLALCDNYAATNGDPTKVCKGIVIAYIQKECSLVRQFFDKYTGISQVDSAVKQNT